MVDRDQHVGLAPVGGVGPLGQGDVSSLLVDDEGSDGVAVAELVEELPRNRLVALELAAPLALTVPGFSRVWPTSIATRHFSRSAGAPARQVVVDRSQIRGATIRLLGINPMIWRRVLVPASYTLQELHGVIQAAMGWEGAGAMLAPTDPLRPRQR